MGHNKPLHNIPLVAHQLDLHALHLPRRRRTTYCRLRACPGNKQAV